MDTFDVFGLMGFVMALIVLDRVKRLERTLRENRIRPGGMETPGNLLRGKEGQSVTITLYESEGSTTTVCKILDSDEEWAHVIRNEGKRNQRELLIRLSDVKQVKP